MRSRSDSQAGNGSRPGSITSGPGSTGSGGQSFSAAGGTGTITITTSATCHWIVGSLPSWLTLTSPALGTGNGTVTFEISPNTGADLSNTFSIGGATFTV